MRRVSPALILALIALFVALAGSTVAATHYRITSTKQIKPNVLRHLKANTGKTGPTGKTGKTGPQGPAATMNVQRVEGTPGTVAPFIDGAQPTHGASTAACPAGTTLIGGGGRVAGSGPSGGTAVLQQNRPEGSTWVVVAVNPGPDTYAANTSEEATVHSWALCARL